VERQFCVGLGENWGWSITGGKESEDQVRKAIRAGTIVVVSLRGSGGRRRGEATLAERIFGAKGLSQLSGEGMKKRSG